MCTPHLQLAHDCLIVNKKAVGSLQFADLTDDLFVASMPCHQHQWPHQAVTMASLTAFGPYTCVFAFVCMLIFQCILTNMSCPVHLYEGRVLVVRAISVSDMRAQR